MKTIQITKTWLTRKPGPWGPALAALSSFLLILGHFVYQKNLIEFAPWMTATPEEVFGQGQIWRAWTTLFVHADAKHLLSNIFLFSIFGSLLASYFGAMVFPLWAFIFGGITNLFVLLDMSPNTQLIGVSGVVFWMGATWLALYLFLDRQKTLTQRILRSLGVGLVIFFPSEAFNPEISYKAHFYGFLLGLLFGSIYYLLNRRLFKTAEIEEALVEDTEAFDEIPTPLSSAE